MTSGSGSDEFGDGLPGEAADRNPLREEDRERLRRVLGFPESIESHDPLDRLGGRRAQTASGVPESAPAAAEVGEGGPGGEEVARRLDQLASRVDALAMLIESVFDRVERSVATSTPLTAEELSDFAARMVRLIEARLEAHSERLEQMVGTTTARPPGIAVNEEGLVDVSVIDDHMAAIGRALIDMQKLIQELERSPEEVHEPAILLHVDRRFEETKSRQASDVENLRRDLHRFDTAFIELQARVAELPDREALRELSYSLNERLNQVIHRLDAIDSSSRLQ